MQPFHDITKTLRRTTPPTATPVTVSEVKRALDLGDDEDCSDELTDLISAAVDMVERDSQRALMFQRWTLTMDEFPCGPIELRRPPVIEVEEVEYSDESNDEQSLEDGTYTVDSVGEPGRIFPVTTWPSTGCAPNAVTVTFTAGYSGSIPRIAWLAIMSAVKALYSGCEVGDGYWSLINRLRWSGPV